MSHPPTVVVITGASAGVGRATARLFGGRGSRVALLARGPAALEATAREIEQLGGLGWVHPTDVSDAEQVEAAAAAVEAELGPIDIWINNATVSVFASLAQMSAAEFRRVTDVSYLGYVWGTMAALKRMRPRNRGTIVQVGSALAYRGMPMQSAYCGAKHAIHGFTESVRTELLQEHSRVWLSLVQLPGLNTPQFDWARNHLSQRPEPVPPIYQPEVAAQAILFAATHRRRELQVGISTVRTILGNKLAPALADRVLAHRTQPGQPAQPQADNLMTPLPGDYGAHGRFDDRAHRFSPQLWTSMHRRWFWGLAALGAGWGWARQHRRAVQGNHPA